MARRLCLFNSWRPYASRVWSGSNQYRQTAHVSGCSDRFFGPTEDVSLPTIEHGIDFEGYPDIHYQIYWEYDNGSSWKEDAIIRLIKKVETYIEETGRETYLAYMESDHGGYFSGTRDKFYPVASK